MIIGDGKLASALKPTDREGWTFFVPIGLSAKEEIDLLAKQDNATRVVYFSSMGIFYSNDKFSKHKRAMEALVKKYYWRYTIVRLGESVSLEELLYYMNMLPPWNCEFNITGDWRQQRDSR